MRQIKLNDNNLSPKCFNLNLQHWWTMDGMVGEDGGDCTIVLQLKNPTPQMCHTTTSRRLASVAAVVVAFEV